MIPPQLAGVQATFSACSGGSAGDSVAALFFSDQEAGGAYTCAAEDDGARGAGQCGLGQGGAV